MSDVLTITYLETAKKHDTFHSEVITGKAGGLASGADIDTATNDVTGQVQATLPKVLRDIGFKPASFNFVTGGTLGVTDADKCIYNPAPAGDDNWYSWGGALPHTVAPGADPAAVGSGYVPRTDVVLRNELAGIDGANLIGGATYATLRSYSGDATTVYVIGVSDVFDGGFGYFDLDVHDVTSDDNGGTILVDSIGRRWKRRDAIALNVRWFYLNSDGNDYGPAVQRAVNATVKQDFNPNDRDADSRISEILFSNGVFNIETPVLYCSNVAFIGVNAAITSNSSEYIFDSAYMLNGVLTSNASLSDSQAIVNRLNGVIFRGLTFYGVTRCLRMRAVNEMSIVANNRFYACGNAISATQSFYLDYKNNAFVLVKIGFENEYSVILNRECNNSNFSSNSFGSRPLAMRIGESGFSCANITVSDDNAFENLTVSSIDVVGTINQFSVDNNYLENLTDFINQTSTSIQQSDWRIGKNKAYNVTRYVLASNLKDSTIDAVTDRLTPSTKCKIEIAAGSGENSVTIKTRDSLGAVSTGRPQLSLSKGCILESLYTETRGSGYHVISKPHVVSGTSESQHILPIVVSGTVGLPSLNVVVGVSGDVVKPAGNECYVDTNINYSDMNTILVTIKMTPTSGTAVYLRFVIMGDSVTQVGSSGFGAYVDTNPSGNTRIHFTGFSSSTYDWMRANAYTSQGAVRLAQ